MVIFVAKAQTDTAKTKTDKYQPSTKPTYNYEDRTGDPHGTGTGSSPLILPDPSKVVRSVELSEDGKYYIIREKIGDIDYRPPTRMTFEQYEKYKKQQELKTYWKENSLKQDAESASDSSPRRLIPPIYVSPKFDRIFGGNYIDIRPNGNVTLDFGGQWQRIDNPGIPIRQQRTGGFLFNQSIALNLQGKIGEKLTIGINWDTKAAFDFDNNIKLSYKGMDHDIIKTIEAGNVSMPTGSTLIQGAQNLFGIKTQLQFGKLKVTTIMANQRGKNESITLPGNAGTTGGATGKEIEIECVRYEENKHFFLSHVFRDNYESAFNSSPVIQSNFQITRCEVYLTNSNSTTKNLRSFVAFADLGEAQPYNASFQSPTANPAIVDNTNNRIQQLLESNLQSLRNQTSAESVLRANSLVSNIDYEIVNSARLLEDGRDYRINRQLGYISLNQEVTQGLVLAVAYEYTYNGKSYRVGEFSTELNNTSQDNTMFLKMIRSSTLNSALYLPMWDLMMKNVYNLGVTNINKQGFSLNVIYKDDATKLPNPYLLEGENARLVNFLTMFNADRVNIGGEANPDANFDYIENYTIDPSFGRLYFPVLEPFGSTLRKYFNDSEQNLIDKYVFQQLYDTTRAVLSASSANTKNKYFIKGRIQSGTAGEILLPGLNVAPASVKLYAGSRLLTQGVDYEISPDAGKITLKPEVQNSGSDIRITYEKADLFSFRQKSLLGSRFDYAVSKDINIGATAMHLNERPLITRVNAGDEPIRNTMLGFDVNYKKESRLLTRMVDKLPLVSTKAPSMLQFTAEYAALLPGNSKVIGDDGNSFIDDFEGSRNPFDLTRSPLRWKFAAPPERFRNNAEPDSLSYGYKRAKLAWYNIDNSFYREGGGNRSRPENIQKEDVDEYHYTRRIEPNEVFPNRSVQPGQINETTLDLAYFPEERGPYNYQSDLDPDGLLKAPEQNFAGITRALAPGIDSDFDNLNVQYIDFWMMDPFIESANNGGVRIINPRTGQYETIENTTGGKLYFNLGNVSEDVLYDRRQSFENGLPADGNRSQENIEETNWGVVSRQQYLVDNFSNSPGARANQDLGYDGLSSTDERFYAKYNTYTSAIANNPVISQTAKDRLLSDVSGDDFQYYLGENQNDKKIIDRYKNFNGLENNSPDNSQSGSFVTSATNTPDNEDLNKNNTIESEEAYYEYMVSLKREDMVVGRNFIINQIVSKSADGKPSTWYQFRIPIRDSSENARIVGNASLKSVRFMRMYLTEFRQPVVIRLAQFQLVASQWRPQPEAFPSYVGRTTPEPPSDNGFSVSTVNVEENGFQTQISSKYVVPPGFRRDVDNTSNIVRLNNEQSLRICVDKLKGGVMRAATKDFTSIGAGGLNCINFESLKMFLHAESANNPNARAKEDVRAILRFGTDLTENFYEIEVPLRLSDVSNDDPAEVWPAENEIDVKFADLSALKALRNYNNPNENNSQRAQQLEKNGKIYRVIGNPDITSVKFFMIGVSNPDTSQSSITKSFCIWANELRLNGYNKSPAQAAVANVNLTLADFATVQLTGGYRSVGFGGLEQKVSDRSQEENIDYGITSNVNLNKFLPEKAGIKLPMTVSYNVVKANPKYDPANPDVLLKNSAELRDDPEEYIKMVSPKRVSKSINFSNVQKIKTKPGAKKHIYDIENISVTAGYSTVDLSNYKIYKSSTQNYLGQLNYTFSPQSKPIEPFKNTKALNSKYFKLVKDFNLSPLPSNIAFRGNMNRFFAENQFRNANLDTVGVKPLFDKRWNFDRNYALRWSLTKSLSMDYNADAKAIIDEPEGRIDNTQLRPGSEITKRDSVIDNLKRLGRVKNFNQAVNLNYKIPLDKLPITDWIGADVGYKVNYMWEANASKQLSDTLGNRIQNTRGITVASRVDFLKLYNKSKFLKKINNPPPKKEPRKKKVYRKRPDGKIDTVEVVVPEFELGKTVLKKIMTLRNINISYTQTENTAIPGYMPTLKFLGFNEGFKAPGLPFIAGSQDLPQFKEDAQQDPDFTKHWITHDRRLSQPIQQSVDKRLNITTQVEPIKDFRVSLTATKNKNTVFSELFKDTTTDRSGDLLSLSNNRTGFYEVSTVSLPSSFSKDKGAVFENAVFNQFKDNRARINERLNENPNYSPGTNQYASNSSQILIPAFISAYLGQDVNSVALSPFPRVPLPNWKIDYSGLANLKFIKKHFPSLTLSHDYKSFYRVNNYTSSPEYTNQGLGNIEEKYSFLDDNISRPGFGDTTESGGNFIPRYVITEVQVRETFGPLIGIQARTKKNVTFGFQLKKDRTVALQTTNAQITEVKNTDYAFNVGFSKTGVKIPFIKVKGRPLPPLKNMTTFRFDITLRDNITIIRKLEQAAIPSVGQWQLQIKPNINYQYSTKLTIQIYYSRVDTKPYTSGSFRNVNTQFGIKLTFLLN